MASDLTGYQVGMVKNEWPASQFPTREFREETDI